MSTSARFSLRALLLPCVIVSGGLFLATTSPPEVLQDEAPVVMQLPASVGLWEGEAVTYCHAETCLTECIAIPGQMPTNCVECGGSLHDISLSEADMLPDDSQFARMLYRRSPTESAFVSIVITGAERSSIHRPEWCLPAQGLQIRGTTRVELATPAGALETSVLDVGRDGSARTEAKYLYWFSSGNGHHVARHASRLFWMAADSLIEGQQHRWAYVSILVRIPNQKALDATAREFAERLAASLYGGEELGSAIGE